MRRASLFDTDSRFSEFTSRRTPPPVGCWRCGQVKLFNHSCNRDGSRCVTCLECGQLDVRAAAFAVPQLTLAAVQIVGAMR